MLGVRVPSGVPERCMVFHRTSFLFSAFLLQPIALRCRSPSWEGTRSSKTCHWHVLLRFDFGRARKKACNRNGYRLFLFCLGGSFPFSFPFKREGRLYAAICRGHGNTTRFGRSLHQLYVRKIVARECFRPLVDVQNDSTNTSSAPPADGRRATQHSSGGSVQTAVRKFPMHRAQCLKNTSGTSLTSWLSAHLYSITRSSGCHGCSAGCCVLFRAA